MNRDTLNACVITDAEIPPAVLEELAAAVRVVRHRHPPPTLVLELGADARGNMRLRLVGVRGISCRSLEVEP